jgi:flagellar hook assembly protein FlgD
VFTAIGDDGPLPLDFALLPNYPNPFNPATKISFTLPLAGHTTLEIYDVLGRVVRTLADGPMEVGYHRLEWDGRTFTGDRATSGVYFARLKSGDEQAVIRMSLVK